MASCAAENDLILFDHDLNDTIEYEDLSMETSINAYSGNNKRLRSESEDSNSSEISMKKHIPTHQKISESSPIGLQVVFAESVEVNLSKVNPIYIAQTINDLVGRVDKVYNTQNGLKILCNKRQAGLFKKEQKFGKYRCNFTIKDINEIKPKVKGIMHGIPLDTDILDIEKELKVQNSFVDIEKVFRLQKFDKIQDKRTDTESVIIVYNSEIVFPSYLYLGYRRLNVKQFIPHPLRCFKCQRFGHISKNCRGKLKCPFCGDNHSFDKCQNSDNKKCSNCGGSHSAGFKGCSVFMKAQEIKEFSLQKKISYAEATKQINLINNSENQTKQTQQTLEKINEDKIISEVFEKVKSQSKQNQEQIVNEIVDQVHSQNKQNQEQIVEKVIEQVQSNAKENEEKNIEKISDNILLKTKEYQHELVDVMKKEHQCKCEIPPEGLTVFIIRAIKCFNSEKFLKNSGDHQSRIIINLFEKCTDIQIYEIKFKKIIHKIMP